MAERGGQKCLIKVFGGRSLSDSCRDLKDVLIALEQSHDTLELIAMACSVQQCGKRGICLFIDLHSRHHSGNTAHGRLQGTGSDTEVSLVQSTWLNHTHSLSHLSMTNTFSLEDRGKDCDVADYLLQRPQN